MVGSSATATFLRSAQRRRNAGPRLDFRGVVLYESSKCLGADHNGHSLSRLGLTPLLRYRSHLSHPSSPTITRSDVSPSTLRNRQADYEPWKRAGPKRKPLHQGRRGCHGPSGDQRHKPPCLPGEAGLRVGQECSQLRSVSRFVLSCSGNLWLIMFKSLHRLQWRANRPPICFTESRNPRSAPLARLPLDRPVIPF